MKTNECGSLQTSENITHWRLEATDQHPIDLTIPLRFDYPPHIHQLYHIYSAETSEDTLKIRNRAASPSNKGGWTAFSANLNRSFMAL
jgi:hypothetical protein